MRYETTVADLSPAQLWGLMVGSIFWVWIVFAMFKQKALFTGMSAVMFWLCVGGAMIALPVWLGLSALAPSSTRP